jgi:hypothetical protein
MGKLQVKVLLFVLKTGSGIEGVQLIMSEITD